MRKMDLLYGVIIGIACCFLGSFLFIVLFMGTGLREGFYALKYQDNLGKLITLGAVLNLIVFFVLLKYNKDLMARGVILSLILLSIFTLLI
ncbi:hypothetical protein [Flavobacterium sp.]|uniref:hypothetical protein n=1 Tax=Flavobacterium sp. TaxID=239 RepID=UPI0039E61323